MKRKMMLQLIQWKEDKMRKPLLVKGVRQVGKTYLLKEFGRLHFKKLHYINFEKEPQLSRIFEQDLNPQRIISELSLHLDCSINMGEDLVVFDEIQEVPKALTSLKYFQEECPSLHICGAGSLLGLHLSHASFPVGKVTFETLRPMSFEEFLIAGKDKYLSVFQSFDGKKPLPELFHEHILAAFKRYLVVGGLPEVVSTYYSYQDNLSVAFSRVRKKQEDLLNSYYADIAKHAGKVNAMHIDRVFRSVPEQLSRSQEGSTARFRFKGVIPGISHYNRLVGAIDWLEAAGLIHKVQIVNTGHLPFKGYAKENLFKLMLFDVGMLGYMSGLPPKAILEADYGGYKGYVEENFVAQELISYGREELFSWQEGRFEVEFLVEVDANPVPLEVKSGINVKAKSLKVFAEKYTPPYQVILSSRAFNNSQVKGSHLYPIYFAGTLSFSRKPSS